MNIQVIGLVISILSLVSSIVLAVITFLYAKSTKQICEANQKSAEYTGKQIEVSNEQFENTNRPYIQVYIDIENKSYVLRVVNTGNILARNVKLKINKEFISGLRNEKRAAEFAQFGDRSFNLASNQSMLALICGMVEQDTVSFKDLSVDVEYYHDINGKAYNSKYDLNLEQFYGFGVLGGFEDKIVEGINKIATNIENIG